MRSSPDIGGQLVGRVMSERFLSEGMIPEVGDVGRLVDMLGRPLRTYRDFVAEITAAA